MSSEVGDLVSLDEIKEICDALEGSERRRVDLEMEMKELKARIRSVVAENEDLKQGLGLKDAYISELELTVVDLNNELAAALSAVVENGFTNSNSKSNSSDSHNNSSNSIKNGCSDVYYSNDLDGRLVTDSKRHGNNNYADDDDDDDDDGDIKNDIDPTSCEGVTAKKALIWHNRVASVRENYKDKDENILSPERYLYLTNATITTNTSSDSCSSSSSSRYSRINPNPSVLPPAPPPMPPPHHLVFNDKNINIIGISNNINSNFNSRNSNNGRSSGSKSKTSSSNRITSKEIIKLEDFDDHVSD